MMEMKEQTGSRKKLLVPVVVLMLCLVTLTGAAYAYSSSLTNTANTVQEDFISIDLETPDYEEDIVASSGTTLAFTDDFIYTKSGDVVTKKDTVQCTITETSIHYKLKIKGDVACNAVKVQSSNIVGFLGTVIGNAKTLDTLIDVKVGLTDSSAAAVGKLEANNTPLTLVLTNGYEKTAAETEQLVDVYIFFTLDSEITSPYTIVSEGNCTVTAETCYNALKTANFDLKFIVEPQAA